jgi:UDP-3-O-[3-hydroxymyristoyl] glucosamine N-acyltransferase
MLLCELARAISAELVGGDPSTDITSCATLEEARSGQVSFLANPKYIAQLQTTSASAVCVSLDAKSDRVALLKTKDPYYAFTQALVILHGHRRHPFGGIHPQAYVDPTATIGEDTTVYPHVFIGPRVKIGRDCIIYPNVTIYDDSIIGDRVTLHAGTSVGEDGFGYATHARPGEAPAHHKIPQIGNVIIEDDVELGANCSIDRATLGSTVIGKGTKFSNNVVIGHGTKIGPHNLYVAQVGVAGSVKTGAYVVMGGQVGIAGHLNIGDGVQIAGQSGAVADLESKTNYLGTPALPIAHARRVWMIYSDLPNLVQRVKALEKRLAEDAE